MIVTLETFRKYWNAYAAKIKEKGKINLHFFMTQYPVEQKSENKFEIKVSSETLKETFQLERAELIDYLNEALNTTFYELDPVVLESAPTEIKKVLTPKDVYEVLKNRNPNLSTLMTDLDLEFL